MDQKKPEKRLTALQEKIRAFNQKHPIGTNVKYTDKKKITHTKMLAGSAREDDKKIVVQVHGVEGLVPIERIQPVL